MSGNEKYVVSNDMHARERERERERGEREWLYFTILQREITLIT